MLWSGRSGIKIWSVEIQGHRVLHPIRLDWIWPSHF